ncbi:GTP-binding protein [Desulfococcaceae bacterium HSG9]|nr:GTP-binding protein [Desulfococcaceae bacterium HSG9]
MTDFTNVYLITGFLGSGKTTLLNRIVKIFPRDKKLTLLVNEFGEVGIDGALVEGDDIDMMEISKGSIFCVCVKTDFIKGLYELKNKIQPDILLIESTGVANPSDLKKDLSLPIFDNRFQFKEQFCVIDVAHFLEAYDVYASLEKQIASSSVFIINKTDLASAEKIAETKKIIQGFHPDPVFIDTSYADIPLERFFDFQTDQTGGVSDTGNVTDSLTAEQLDEFIDKLFDSPDLELTPPDLLMSAVYKWNGDDLEDIRTMAESLPKGILRAKGFIEDRDQMFLFSYVMGDWSMEKAVLKKQQVEHKNAVVFIGPPPTIENLPKTLAGGQWDNIGTLQPFSSPS